MTTATDQLSSIPHPSGAVEVDGIQRSDGAVDRKLRVCHLHHAEPITPEQARQLAQALIAAADDYEQMNGYDQL